MEITKRVKAEPAVIKTISGDVTVEGDPELVRKIKSNLGKEGQTQTVQAQDPQKGMQMQIWVGEFAESGSETKSSLTLTGTEDALLEILLRIKRMERTGDTPVQIAYKSTLLFQASPDELCAAIAGKEPTSEQSSSHTSHTRVAGSP